SHDSNEGEVALGRSASVDADLPAPQVSGTKIVSVEAIPLGARMKEAFRFEHVQRTSSENVVLRLETDAGLIGYGEACSVPQLSSERRASMVDLLETDVAPILLGADP